MSNNRVVKRRRTLPKSCAECRRRKIKCVWSEGNAQVCEGCREFERECFPQLLPRHTISQQNLKPPGSERISRLERELVDLRSLVEGQTTTSTRPDYSGENELTRDQRCFSEPDELDSPLHLRLLFDGISNKDEVSQRVFERQRLDPAKQVSETILSLLPRPAELEVLSGHVSQWVDLYEALFPQSAALLDTKAMIIQRQQSANDPDLARNMRLLLSIAITVLQIPQQAASLTLNGCPVAQYVQDVVRVFETEFLNSDTVSGTVQSLEAILLYVRLQLGRGRFRKMWLALRRAIALAELSGISRVSTFQVDRTSVIIGQSAELDVWEAICATDRNCSMMFNLPAGTASYPFPREDDIISHGKLNPKVYNYHLANICFKIHDLDEAYSTRKSDIDTYAFVLQADHDLRKLASKTSNSWWQGQSNIPLAEQLVQFWHYYLVTRVHLRHVVKMDPEGQFVYSQARCLKGCQESIQRFLELRKALPTEFFICRVVDIQTCTMCILLLLLLSRNPSAARQSNVLLVDQVVDTFRNVHHSPSAQESAEAIKSFKNFIAGTNPSPHDPSLTLRIPLLGKIQVRLWQEKEEVSQDGRDTAKDLETSHNGGYQGNSNGQQIEQTYVVDAVPPEIELPCTFDFEASSLSWMDDLWDSDLFAQNA